MSAFEDFVQTELPLRPYVSLDGTQESIAIRRGIGPRQVQFLNLEEGQVLSKVGGVLAGRTFSGGGRHYVLDIPLGSSAAVWNIAHGMQSFNCVVQSYHLQENGSYHLVIPDSVILIDQDTLSLSFSQALSGKAVVSFVD